MTVDIKPIEINAARPLHSAFGSHEAEVAAMWIIRFCQYRSNWEAFERDDIQDFYENHGGQGDFRFCCLIDTCDTDVYHVMSMGQNTEPWVECMKDDMGQYVITDDFIKQAYKKHKREYDR